MPTPSVQGDKDNTNNDEDSIDTASDATADWTHSVDKQAVKKNDLQRATFIPLGSDTACLVTDQRNCSQISVETKYTAWYTSWLVCCNLQR